MDWSRELAANGSWFGNEDPGSLRSYELQINVERVN
jgi:hypothetical protein